jgi:hypothetical protein
MVSLALSGLLSPLGDSIQVKLGQWSRLLDQSCIKETISCCYFFLIVKVTKMPVILSLNNYVKINQNALELATVTLEKINDSG